MVGKAPALNTGGTYLSLMSLKKALALAVHRTPPFLPISNSVEAKHFST